jgi:hypothetical protein
LGPDVCRIRGSNQHNDRRSRISRVCRIDELSDGKKDAANGLSTENNRYEVSSKPRLLGLLKLGLGSLYKLGGWQQRFSNNEGSDQICAAFCPPVTICCLHLGDLDET